MAHLQRNDEEHNRVSNDFRYHLEFLVEKATNVDQLSGVFSPLEKKMNCVYRVIVSDQSGAQFRTRATLGMPEPTWNQWFDLLFDYFPGGEVLNLEIVEENCFENPSTSEGIVVVGRARISLPERLGVSEKRKKIFIEQVGYGKKIGGFIHFEMKLSMCCKRRKIVEV